MSSTLPVDNTNGKQTLLPLWFIIIFFLSIIIIAYLFFPLRTLREQTLLASKPEPIAFYYLSEISKRYPQDNDLRIALVKQEIGLYHWNLAEAQLKTLEKNPQLKKQTRLLRFQLKYTQAFKMQAGNHQQQIFTELRKDINDLQTESWSQDELHNLATLALSINQPAVALKFYERLTPMTDPQMLKQIARTALAASQYAVCAKYYMLAAEQEKTLTLKRSDIVAALQALQAGRLYQAGINIIKNLSEEIINEKNMLLFLTQYTLAAGRPDMAQGFAKRALLPSMGQSSHEK